jgi:hypothetical protein
MSAMASPAKLVGEIAQPAQDCIVGHPHGTSLSSTMTPRRWEKFGVQKNRLAIAEERLFAIALQADSDTMNRD